MMIGALLGALVILLIGTTDAATPLPDYTGYTRVGFPPADDRIDPKIAPAAGPDARALGVTVYYMVLDRKGANARGTTGDIFGTGIPGFDAAFVAGKNSDRDRLDTEARYLYLYQVVNDSNREAAVKSTSIQLIIDPRLITSWGFFSDRKKNEKGLVVRRGLSFLAPGENGDKGVAEGIRAVSTDFPAVSDRRYRSPAPPITSKRPYGFSTISLGERPAAPGDDTGKEPETVLLVTNADFGIGEENPYRRSILRTDTDALPEFEDEDGVTRSRSRLRDEQRRRWPAVRAVWSDEDPLRKRERSTLFGFTSDYPPTMENVAVGGRMMRVNPGAGIPAIPGADGKIAPAVGDEKKAPADKDKKPLEGIAPAAGAIAPAAGEAEGAALPLSVGTVPTPIPPGIRTAAASTAATPAPVSTGGGLGSLGPAFGPGLGGMPSGGGVGGGGMGMPTPGGAAGFGGGQGGGIGGGFPAGGGFGGGGGGEGDLQGRNRPNQEQNENQGQGQGQRININVINNNKNINKNNNHNHNHNSGCCDNGGNVIPAPPAWLLGLLGLPVFAFLASRRRKADSSVSSEVDQTTPAV